MQIVIVWATRTRVWDGKPFRADLGQMASMKDVLAPHACMWVNAGTPADMLRARAYCAAENAKNDATTLERRAVTYFDEAHPLERARREYA